MSRDLTAAVSELVASQNAMAIAADVAITAAGARIADLEAALRDVRARAHFELHNPTPFRDTALSMIVKAVNVVLDDKIG